MGVAPSFTLPGADSESGVWAPYSMLGAVRPADTYFEDSRAHWLSVIGRRDPNYSLDQVRQEVSVLARRADEEVPGRITSLVVTDGSLVQNPDLRERAPLIFSIALGSTGLLLLLACVNVTTLLLSRAAARQREIAVRLSLGAGRYRLLRQLLTESLLLSGLAAAISLAIAYHAPTVLWNSLMRGPAPFDLIPDARVLFYCLITAFAAGILSGLSPAVETIRPHISDSLKGSSANVTSGRKRSRLRSTLVAVQVALSLLLLVQATLFLRAQQRYLSYDPGFETKNVISVTLASVLSGYQPPPAFYQELQSRMQTIPGVSETSYVSIPIWRGRNSTELNAIDGQPFSATHDFNKDPARRLVEPEYFSALSMPLVRGRVFRRDAGPAVIPVVISESMAQKYWPGKT